MTTASVSAQWDTAVKRPPPPENKTPFPAVTAPKAAGSNPGISHGPYRPWSCSSARPGWLPIFGHSPGSSPSSSRTPAARSCSVPEADLPLSAFNVYGSVNLKREKKSQLLPSSWHQEQSLLLMLKQLWLSLLPHYNIMH